MRECAQWRQLCAGKHRLEGKWVHFDVVEDVLAAEKGREIVVDAGEQEIGAEFPCLAMAFQAQRLCRMNLILARAARKDGGAAEAIGDAVDSFQYGERITEGLLQIARE